MSKRRRNSKNQSNILMYVVIFLSIVATVVMAFVAGYYFGFDKSKDVEIKKESPLPKIEQNTSDKKHEELSNKLKDILKKDDNATQLKDKEALEAIRKDVKDEKTQELEKNITKIPQIQEVASSAKQEKPVVQEKKLKDKEKPKKEPTPPVVYEDASHEYEDESLNKPTKREKISSAAKPKLAIIIDDVSTSAHVKAIKNLNMPITMSFLPPSELRPNSNDLAAKEEFYMVHLPMEANSFKGEEPLTLRINDSQDVINQRVLEIKKFFPRVKYINNHTGSKFTSDEEAVNRLITALKDNGINFIDSRTIGASKVPVVMKKHGKKYISRDVFLDHNMDKNYVKTQIKESIKIAKNHGSAVAIGHPHANTISAISESKELFKDIDLILVNKLY